MKVIETMNDIAVGVILAGIVFAAAYSVANVTGLKRQFEEVVVVQTERVKEAFTFHAN